MKSFTLGPSGAIFIISIIRPIILSDGCNYIASMLVALSQFDLISEINTGLCAQRDTNNRSLAMCCAVRHLAAVNKISALYRRGMIQIKVMHKVQG